MTYIHVHTNITSTCTQCMYMYSSTDVHCTDIYKVYLQTQNDIYTCTCTYKHYKYMKSRRGSPLPLHHMKP